MNPAAEPARGLLPPAPSQPGPGRFALVLAPHPQASLGQVRAGRRSQGTGTADITGLGGTGAAAPGATDPDDNIGCSCRTVPMAGAAGWRRACSCSRCTGAAVLGRSKSS